MPSRKTYEPTDVAKVSPVELPVFHTGKLRMVAVGGKIVIPAKPPKRSERVVPTASQKDLEELFNRGYKWLIQIKQKEEK